MNREVTMVKKGVATVLIAIGLNVLAGTVSATAEPPQMTNNSDSSYMTHN